MSGRKEHGDKLIGQGQETMIHVRLLWSNKSVLIFLADRWYSSSSKGGGTLSVVSSQGGICAVSWKHLY